MEKRDWQTWVADYLTFSRRERVAVLVLVLLVLLVWIVPRLWMPSPLPLKVEDSVLQAIHPAPRSPERQLRSFDPNTLDLKGWEALGVASAVAQRIVRYREKGGMFRQASDLGKIYGMDTGLVQALRPYVSITATVRSNGRFGDKFPGDLKSKLPARFSTSATLEINTADSLAWMDLPGIGPVLAGRVIRYRERLGGFYAKEQLREIYGTDSSLWIRLAGRLRLDQPALLHQLPLNEAGREELAGHPYIRWRLAGAIIRYREVHGPFREVGELRQIHLINDSIYGKLLPYWKIH